MTETNAYEDFQAGVALLRAGDVHAAAVALERARALEPDKGSIRETLGRAYFRSRRFAEAREEFEVAVALNPTNDYGHFALGMSLLRLGEHATAVGHLKLAVVMNPSEAHYSRALSVVAGAR
jgi:Flp pilus assembly protein TadD